VPGLALFSVATVPVLPAYVPVASVAVIAVPKTSDPAPYLLIASWAAGLLPVQSATDVEPDGSSSLYTNRGLRELISSVSGSDNCCCDNSENVSTAVGLTLPYVPAMSHDGVHRSVHPAYIGNHTPGHCHVVAVEPFSNCQPSTCTLQVAAAVDATATPTSMPAAVAGAVAVTVTVVHPAVAEPVNGVLVP